jgi:hypothetical protein
MGFRGKCGKSLESLTALFTTFQMKKSKSFSWGCLSKRNIFSCLSFFLWCAIVQVSWTFLCLIFKIIKYQSCFRGFSSKRNIFLYLSFYSTTHHFGEMHHCVSLLGISVHNYQSKKKNIFSRTVSPRGTISVFIIFSMMCHCIFFGHHMSSFRNKKSILFLELFHQEEHFLCLPFFIQLAIGEQCTILCVFWTLLLLMLKK